MRRERSPMKPRFPACGSPKEAHLHPSSICCILHTGVAGCVCSKEARYVLLFCRRNANPGENAKPLQQAKRAFSSCQALKLQRTCAVKLTKPSKLFVFGKSLEDTIIYSRLHYSVSYLATLSWSVKLRARLVMPLYVKLLYSVSLPSSSAKANEHHRSLPGSRVFPSIPGLASYPCLCCWDCSS